MVSLTQLPIRLLAWMTCCGAQAHVIETANQRLQQIETEYASRDAEVFVLWLSIQPVES